MSSLFGKPAGGGNLFAPPASSTASPSNLFAPSAAQQPAKASIFNFANPQASQPPAASSASTPFGGLDATTSTSQPAGATGLFGLGQPATSGLGVSSQPQQPAAALSGLFAGIGQRPAAPPTGQSQQSNQPHAQNVAPGLQSSQTGNNVRTAYFEQILERGRKRNNAENGVLGDLPSLQLGLGDIARKVRNLGTGGPSSQEARDGAAVPNAQQSRAGDTRA
jgi:nuclear pore complex protein Nup93